MNIRPLPSDPRYHVSDTGLIFGPKFGLKRPLKPVFGTAHGWVCSRVTIGRTPRRVHQLVLEAFVGPRPEGMGTRHLNGNSLDNRLENLVYGTASENTYDQVTHGTHQASRKAYCSRGHEFTHTARGQRICRECGRIRMQMHRTRRASAA